MNDLLERSISAIIGAVLLIFTIYKGGLFLFGMTFVLSVVGIYELWKAFRNKDIDLNLFLLILATILMYADVFINNKITNSSTIIFLIYVIFTIRQHKTISSLALANGSLLYIVGGFLKIIDFKSIHYLILVFIISFSTDIFAYLVGNLIGKNKLAPTISPNKTIEGAVGGIVGSVIVSIIYVYVTKIIEINVLTVVILAVVSLFGQLGDLLASLTKRSLEIEDYGNIMPGHGGVLDRFDSVIMVLHVFSLVISYI